MGVVEELTRNAIGRVTAENWQKCMAHIRKLEQEYERNIKKVLQINSRRIANEM